MSTPTSFRFPFELPEETHPTVKMAIRYAFSGLKDLNDAIRSLNTKVGANTTAIQQVNTGALTVNTGGGGGGGGSSGGTHSEPLTDGNSNFIFANGDIIVAFGVPN